jgi:hypothetical protein
MAHYDITYTCGHTDRINIIGPHRARASRIAFLESGPCFECYKTEHQAAREQAEALDLPAFTDGSPAQQQWAETLRVQILAKIEAELEAIERRADPNRQRTSADLDAERQVLHAITVIAAETSAKWWIDHRYDSVTQIIREVARAELAKPTAAETQAKQAAARKAEADKALALAAATVRPEQPKTATVAEIHASGNVVSVIFPEKRDDFREIVKGLGYAWDNSRWQRTIGRFAGLATDRVAELGHALLTAGFCICLLDDAIRAAAIAGDYAPECTRWVQKCQAGEHKGWFVILWARSEDFYAAARKITGSRYDAPHVVVPPEQYEQVLDFAARYGFQLSDAAQGVVDVARAAKAQMLTVQPTPKRKVTAPADAASDVPPVMVVPDDVQIAPELRDE